MSKQPDNSRMEVFRRKIEETLRDLTESNGLEILGDLKVDIAKLDTVALMKRNKIFLDENASHYPNYILKYILAHEVAHLAVKGHGVKFWEIVRRIYPDYQKGKDELHDSLGLNKEISVSA